MRRNILKLFKIYIFKERAASLLIPLIKEEKTSQFFEPARSVHDSRFL